jgi:ketosteroid isomerase-like protein
MDDEYAISSAKSEYREAINAGDVDRLMAVIADTFTDMTDGKASFYLDEGPRVYRWRMGELFAKNEVQTVITIINISIFGDFAFDLGWEKRTLIPKDGGEPTTARYRYFETWKKGSDGKWRISSFINNKDLPPEMAPEGLTAAS